MRSWIGRRGEEEKRRGIAPWIGALVVTLSLGAGACRDCEGWTPPPTVLEQYHADDQRPWRSYWKFQNLCDEDLSDPNNCGSLCRLGGALPDDHFTVRIMNSRDRDQIYFFSRGFQESYSPLSSVPVTSAVWRGPFGVLSGDSEWTDLVPFDGSPVAQQTTRSIRYYDRGDCSEGASIGMLRKKIFDSFWRNLRKLTRRVEVLSTNLRPLLGTTRCGDPYVAYSNDYFEFRAEYELTIGSLLPPYDPTVYVDIKGWFQLGSGARCARTDLRGTRHKYGYYQGDYVDPVHCERGEPDRAWRRDQVVVTGADIRTSSSTPPFCYPDLLLCGPWLAAIKIGLSTMSAGKFRNDLEEGLHGAMWATNTLFEGDEPCSSHEDCRYVPLLGIDMNPMLFDVRCRREFVPPRCPAGYELAEPPAAHRCQLRPTVVRRVDVHPDRFELVFLEHGETTHNPFAFGGLPGYRNALERAGLCFDSANPAPGAGRIMDNWYCGDGKRDQHEECDGSDFGPSQPVCADVHGPLAIGEVICGADCRPSYSSCCVPTEGGRAP